MAPRKRQQKNNACSALAAAPPTLPADLLLEITARSDTTTLVRCAAACRLLRRRILNDTFIQQQAACIMPAWAVLRIHTREPLVSTVLLHPAKPDNPTFVDRHIAPFVSRGAAHLLRQYDPVTSRRRGLIILSRRRHLKKRKTSWKLYGYAYA